MKKLFILSVLMIGLFNSSVFACSCPISSFCATNTNNNNLIISGQIIEKFNNGIKVKLLKRIRGIELRDTITIWSGTPDSCMGIPWVHSEVGDFGAIQDTVIASLTKISSVQNTWDSIGDYRFQNDACKTYYLNVKKDTVRGYISSPDFSWPVYYERIQYQQFVDNYDFNINRCGVVSIKGLNHNISISIYPNPSTNEVNIEFNNTKIAGLNISYYNFLGEKVLVNQSSIPNGIKILRNNLTAGIYFLQIASGEEVITRKIVFVD